MPRCRVREGLGIGLVGLGLLAGPAVAADETAAKVQEVTAKARNVERYRAEFTLTVTENDQASRLSGTIWYQRPDKRRIEFSTAPAAEDVAQLVVSDGVAEWQYFPGRNTVYRTDWTVVKAAGTPVDALQLRGLHEPFIDVTPGTIRFVKAKTEGRHSLYVFEAEPAQALMADAPFAPGKVQLEVSAADGLTRRLAMTDAQGQEVLVQQYTKVEANVPIAASQFAFTPPSGTEVVDISQDRARAAGQPPAAGGRP